MTAFEVRYTFADKVHGSFVLDLTDIYELSLTDNQLEDKLRAVIRRMALDDLENGVKVTNLDAAIAWGVGALENVDAPL